MKPRGCTVKKSLCPVSGLGVMVVIRSASILIRWVGRIGGILETLSLLIILKGCHDSKLFYMWRDSYPRKGHPAIVFSKMYRMRIR